MKRLKFTQRAIAKYQTSSLRPYFRTFEELVRPLVRKRSRILLGPMRGCLLPQGDRGMLLGTYESQVQEVLQDYLRAGDVFYDVGAHRGYLSLLGCVLVGPQGHVYSFEPLPPNASILRQVITANHVIHHTLVAAAVSNVKGSAELFLGDGNDYRASLFQWKSGNRLEIETLTLDEFVKTHRPPTLVKVDVEGAELLVLEGAADLLTGTHPPSWVIEVHSEQLDKAVNEVLARHSYRIRYMDTPSSVRRRPYPRHLIAESL